MSAAKHVILSGLEHAHDDIPSVSVSKDLPSGEDDGSAPWTSTSKGTENLANLPIL